MTVRYDSYGYGNDNQYRPHVKQQTTISPHPSSNEYGHDNNDDGDKTLMKWKIDTTTTS
jgi:hypothetical protein